VPRSLVTGAAGFIGSHVVDCLVTEGHDVVALDNLSGGLRENVNPRARWVAGDILDATLINKLFAQERFTYVFHLAAYAAEGLSHFIRRFNYTNNVIGSMNLINASVASETVECFVFASSIAVYGEGQPPLTEDTVPQPEDPYGIAKFAVEMDLRAARRIFGLDSIVFRPHNVYGERQNIGDRFRNVIGIFMNQAMRGEPFTIFGDGEQTRAFSYVSGVAPLIAASVKVPMARNQVFNVGADIPYSVRDIAAAVSAAFDVPLRINHLPPRKEVVDSFSSHAKVVAIFGLQEEVPLREGIQRMAAWARGRGPQLPSKFTSLELLENIPPSWTAWVEMAGNGGVKRS
jgi:UDP-glucose 4-epimerase